MIIIIIHIIIYNDNVIDILYNPKKVISIRINNAFPLITNQVLLLLELIS
jgi:hypothetical protein